MVTIKGSDLQQWVSTMSDRWREFVTRNPRVLALPCDIREAHTVAELLQHIVAVELRYAQRLSGMNETAYDEIPADSADAIYRTHDQAMALLSSLVDRDDAFWDESLHIVTRSAGEMDVSRRVVFVHLFTHSVRHYAQLATLVRQHGSPVDFSMDYLMMFRGNRA